MNRQRSKKTIQTLAVAVTLTAVLIMLTPLRRGPGDASSRQAAGWMPLLNLGGLADSPAFHRLEHAPLRDHASAGPLLRRISPPQAAAAVP